MQVHVHSAHICTSKQKLVLSLSSLPFGGHCEFLRRHFLHFLIHYGPRSKPTNEVCLSFNHTKTSLLIVNESFDF